MSKTSVRRTLFKLAVLIVMVGALLISRSGTQAQFGSPTCDNNYQYCVQTCVDQTGGSYEDCSYGSCANGYFSCWQNGNPPTGQPRKPCPPCVAECDFNQQACLAEGSLTTQQCAYFAYKCKQRCNYECVY